MSKLRSLKERDKGERDQQKGEMAERAGDRGKEPEREREKKVLPRGVVSLSALSSGRPTTVSYTAEDIQWKPRSTSGFLIMKCSRLHKFSTVERVEVC